MRFFVWAYINGGWKVVAITTTRDDAIAVYERYPGTSYIGDNHVSPIAQSIHGNR